MSAQPVGSAHAAADVPASSAAPVRAPGGPCAQAREEVVRRCTEAERLTRIAQSQQGKLREARQRHGILAQQLEADAEVRDRRRLAEAKLEAQRQYHAALAQATEQAPVQAAAANWLRTIDRLNRQAEIAAGRATELSRQARELEQALPGIELAADAARIAAEAAQVDCLEARRRLAACEEEAQRLVPMATATPPAPSTAVPGLRAAAAATPSVTPATDEAFAHAAGESAVARAVPAVTRAAPAAEPPVDERAAPIMHQLLRGDRQTILGLAMRLAEETGIEAGRLQLLLIELREAIADRALESHALGFPGGHPFWSQFSAAGAARVATSLAVMGFRFDGRGGWLDGRSPTIRDLGLALAYSGYEPRSLRRPAGQAAVDALWQGTRVLIEEWLASQAPGLELSQVVACLGPRAASLGDLWDAWGRLRPLLAG